MAIVTVGSSSQSFNFSGGAGLTIAQQIANLLQAQGVTTTTVTGSGNAPAAPTTPGNQQLVIAPTVSGAVSVPAGYNVVTNASTLPGTINATGGAAIISGNGGGTFTETGAATIAASGGSNTILQSGAGAIQLAGGDGNDTISGAGTGTIAGGAGSNVIFVNGTGDVVLSTGTDTIVMGTTSGSDTVDLRGSTRDIVWANNGSSATIIGAGTNEIVTGGAGSLTYISTAAGAATVVGGSTQATLFGSAGSNVSFSNASAGGAVFTAGSGNETLNASNASSNVIGWGSTDPNGDTRMFGGGGADTLVAGGSFSQLTGNGGADVFVVLAGRNTGIVSITDMTAAADTLIISGYNTAATRAAITAAGNSSAVTLSDGTTIVFQNVSVSSVSSKILVG